MPSASHCAGDGLIPDASAAPLLDRSARSLDIAPQLGDDAQQRLLALDFPIADEDRLAVLGDDVK